MLTERDDRDYSAVDTFAFFVCQNLFVASLAFLCPGFVESSATFLNVGMPFAECRSVASDTDFLKVSCNFKLPNFIKFD